MQWSPDGSRLALDYDADNDYWNELAVMAADGSGLHTVFDANQNMVDAWMGSWSPDGQSLLFSVIAYVEDQGNLYYDVAVIARMPAAGGTAVALPGSGMEKDPDWQKTDWLLPTSSMTPLPAVAPAAIALSWTGADAGPAGLAGFDVQVRDGTGAWIDWLAATPATSETYAGMGGHTYYFRVRARDTVGNVEAWPDGYDAATTVEALPPVSAVDALPAHMGNGGIVRWHGADPGGSGIRSYDVQYRAATVTTWTDWLSNTTQTAAAFTGTVGQAYVFRVRARDAAENVEAVHAAAGDASTTLAAWAASGAVRTNRARPAANTTVTVQPSGQQGVSRPDGVYNVFSTAAQSDAYTITWANACFGALPAASFANNHDMRVDAVLPPLDDVVADGDFESGALAPGWQAGGAAPPVLAAEAVHTGAAGVRLGSRSFSSAQVVAATRNGSAPVLTLRIDSRGALHALWLGETYLLYAQRPAGGAWSAAYNVASNANGIDSVDMAVDDNDNVHLIWQTVDTLFYARRSAAGTWSAPETIVDSPRLPQLAVDQRGIVHLFWQNYNDYYAQRGLDGVWSTPEVMPWNDPVRGYLMNVAQDGTVHACRQVYPDSENQAGLSCAVRDTHGVWTLSLAGKVPIPFPALSRPLVDRNGVAHVLLWGQQADQASALYYARRETSGTWSITPLVTSPFVGYAVARLEGRDTLHVVWAGALSSEYESSAYHMVKRGAAPWSPPERIASNLATFSTIDYPPAFDLAIDAGGVLHAAWRTKNGDYSPYESGAIYYTRQEAAGWTEPILVVGSKERDGGMPRLAVDAQRGIAHMLWSLFRPPGMEDIMYASSVAAATGDSRLAQTVTIPASQAGSTLSFMYRLGGATRITSSRCRSSMEARPPRLLSTATDTRNWTHRWFDLAPWAGKTVTLAFTLHQTAGAPAAWADLDEVTVGSGLFADVWAHQLSQVVEPGEPITYTIRYGNAGGVLAAGVRVSTTLPAALTLLAADPPPSATDGQTLTWSVGDLPAGSRGEITLSAQVAAGAAPHSVLRGSLSITTATCEVEIANNTAAPAFFVSGGRAWLPLIRR